MPIKNVLFILVFLAALSIFYTSLKRLYKFMMIARKKDKRTDNISRRILNVIKVAFGQSKLLRDPAAGLIHFFIFWGFVLFLFSVMETIIQGFHSEFNLAFTGPLYMLITLVQDVFSILIIIAVIAALYRRYFLHVARLEVDKKGKADAAFILLMIMFICIFLLGQNSALVARENYQLAYNEIRPLSLYFAGLFSGSGNASFFYEVFWWGHILVILLFLNYLPYSKHLHVITSIPNTYLANVEPHRMNIKPLNLEDESAETFGASDIEHLSWKQILDGYTCTECGRCTDSCPAANSGKSLSPRKIIVDIRKRTLDKAGLVVEGKSEGPAFEKTLVHDYISDIELWQCTTCGACMQECPVMIEHIDSIVDMRRHLVLTESQFPSVLNNVFKSIEVNYTPWAFNSADRAEWADGLGIKTMAEDRKCDYLFWVGCAGSFDNRYKKVSRAFAQIMQRAGIDFRILGTEEKCNGDTARRLGNEYLAQMMIQQNVETLNSYGVKKIVTACPHCFQSLGREYKQFGGDYEVVHHSQLIMELIESGRLLLAGNGEKMTYHDSCYLGRYNNIYEEPRNILGSNKGNEVTEMKRNRSRGFCCGAGGGRMFLEDEEGEKINIERTGEALATGASTIASACPFCMTMLTDGVKHFDKTEEVSVKDIAEIVLDQIN